MRTNSNFLFVIMGFLMAIAVVIAIAFAIYKSLYTRRINKRLAEGRKSEIKPMISPVRFVITTLVVIILIIAIIMGVCIILFSSQSYSVHTNGVITPTMIEVDTESDDSPYEGYTFGDEIKGFDVYTIKNKELQMKVYTPKEQYSSVLPAALIAVERSSDKNFAFCGTDFTYYQKNAKLSTGTRDGAAYYDSNKLYVINTNGYTGKFKAAFCVGYEEGPGEAMYRRSSDDYDEYISVDMTRDERGIVQLLNTENVAEE